MKAVLKLPAYRRLLVAYSLNELAWSIGSLGLAYLVYRRTGSALGATAFFLCAQFIPALLSPIFVARFDRLPARQILPALYALEGLAYLSLAYVAAHFVLAAVLILATVDGVIALVARSLARASHVAVTTEHGLLRQGNAITNTAFSTCFMAGPAIGGVLVAAGGTSSALLVNSGLFALIALTLVTARGLPAASGQRAATASRVRAALAHARGHAAIHRLLMLQAAALLFFTLSIPVEVVFARHSLHTGAGGYGALLAAWGTGAVAGSGIYARWLALPPRALIAIGAGALGVGFVIMAAAPSLAVAIVGAVVAGAGNGVEAVSARTAVQEQVEHGWMAMMMSLNESIAESVPGAGILLGGAIAALSSPRVALAVAGAGSLAITAAAWLVLRPPLLAEGWDRTRAPTVSADGAVPAGTLVSAADASADGAAALPSQAAAVRR